MSSMWLGGLAALIVVQAGARQEVVVGAERVKHLARLETTIAEGRAHLRASGVALDAEQVFYDRRRAAATAVGSVVLRVAQGGLIAVTADAATVFFDGEEVREVFLLDGRAVSKKGVPAEVFLEASTPDAVRAAGVTTAVLTGQHLSRDGSRWTVEGLELSPCDCDLDHPSWGIRAPLAVVDLDAERVEATGPSVAVFQVPVLWFPWLSLPLNDRQSGLLFPRPSASAQSGFGIELPLFLTLGRSADVTVTPGYFTGPTPLLGQESPHGVRGPKLSVEARWAPSVASAGRATLGLLYDLRSRRDPVDSAFSMGQPRGLRFEAALAHLQDFEGGFGTRIDTSVHSDGYLQRDSVTDVIARENGYLRSTLAAFHRGAGHLVSIDAVVRQDLATGHQLFGPTPRFAEVTGAPRFGPRTMQRLPAVSFELPQRVIGPVWVALRGALVRHAPLLGGSGDEGQAAQEGRASSPGTPWEEVPTRCLRQRLYFPFVSTPRPGATVWLPRGSISVESSTPTLSAECGLTAADKAGQGDGAFQTGEREARLRLEVLPQMGLHLHPFGAASLLADVSWRQGVWRGEVTGRTSQRSYPVLSARLESEVTRSFGEGTLRHVIVPSVHLKAVPFVLGDTPAPYDEVDLAIPGAGSWAQTTVEVRQRLARRGAPDIVQLELGQAFGLAEPWAGGPRVSESYGRLAVSAGWLRAAGSIRLEPVGARMTSASASLELDAEAGRGGYLRFQELLDDGTARTRQPLDLLVGSPLSPRSTDRASQLTAGARYRLAAWSIAYDALFVDGRAAPGGVPLRIAQHTLGTAWTPACDCWRLELALTHRPAPGRFGDLDARASLTISGFGTVGLGR